MVVSNEDLLLEILLRLPVKSLVRFKLVSRHWGSLISDSKFCSNHTRFDHTSSTLGIYYYSNPQRNHGAVKAIALSGAGHILPPLCSVFGSELIILHASKGLFLCSLGDRKPFVICNLTSQKHNQLPQHLHASNFRNRQSPSNIGNAQSPFLYFDPSKSLHYKVVLVGWYNGKGDYVYYKDDDREGDYSPSDGGGCYEIDIYSSKSRSWKRKHFQVPPGSVYDFDYMALCNGAIHWMSVRDLHVYFEIDTEKLVANPIDLESEILERTMSYYFEECCGHIFLIPIENCTFNELFILEMDKGFNWSVKYIVNIIPLTAFLGKDFVSPNPLWSVGKKFKYWEFSVLGVVKEDETSDFALLLAVSGKIISYDTKMETFKMLSEFLPNGFSAYTRYVSAYPFVPTLCPI